MQKKKIVAFSKCIESTSANDRSCMQRETTYDVHMYHRENFSIRYCQKVKPDRQSTKMGFFSVSNAYTDSSIESMEIEPKFLEFVPQTKRVKIESNRTKEGKNNNNNKKKP